MTIGFEGPPTEVAAMTRVPIDRATALDDVRATVRAWVDAHVPAPWRAAAEQGGRAAIRAVRPRALVHPARGEPVAVGGRDVRPHLIAMRPPGCLPCSAASLRLED